MSALQRWLSGLSGRRIGTDSAGNVYFESRGDYLGYGRKRRWVVYSGPAEATLVPPEWHGWLHHTIPAPIENPRPLAWQKPHQPNLTGTSQAWSPTPRGQKSNHRPVTAGDYEAWTPGS
ncbi:NADH-ubiquinone oxidoreductase subunit NDUFA12 family protein [Roseomonas populi]|uniref:NADH-ubiquinone oxidoreductase subunit NDUFA12 family protein n=1 Tax=Roseomonas populi TaxID=3121582 RepID=A0ABT1X0V8_9PROT|nr:NADH-ubiquinone oxidoreductase subunit NDUFA12 family protein [Roseomonas pecuniae]MCR0981733.1 NADH-ubiquinone oxidoreductase subunit NDUFA12 family protein [Roseomonas pecuniae]